MIDSLKKLLKKSTLAPILFAMRALFYQAADYPKWKKLRNKKAVWLEFGAGRKPGENGWVTVDLSGADIRHDLRKGIPLPPESVDRIYTSHMLEHIPFKELEVFINECWRVLKHGGEFSVCVPDASLYINAYVEGRWFRLKGKGYKPAVIDTGSLIDQVNYIAYMDSQHRYMFDQENLVNTLKKAPFRSVIIRPFDSELDLVERDFESVYASAIK